MSDTLEIVAGVRVLVGAADGPALAGEADANDLIGAAWGAEADLVVVPIERLGPGFLELKTRIAGLVVQKFVNYQLRLAIIGDVSPYVARSQALAEYVRECDRGRAVWFLDSLRTLRGRLEAEAGARGLISRPRP
jgi:hypothetical protein